jgi:hypothetical protein
VAKINQKHGKIGTEECNSVHERGPAIDSGDLFGKKGNPEKERGIHFSFLNRLDKKINKIKNLNDIQSFKIIYNCIYLYLIRNYFSIS